MALLDSLIRDIDQRFGLGNKSAAFVTEIVRYMFDSDLGGFKGFIDRFEKAGFGDIAASWVAKRKENRTVSGAQLEDALGINLINRLRSQFSLAGSTVRNALGYATPKLVDLLTPDGIIPDQIPADVQSFLGSAAVRLGPMAAAGVLPEAEDSRRIGPLGWLLALLWSALLGYWALTGPKEPVVPDVAAVQPKAWLPARLALSNTDGKIEFSGVVPDEKTRTRILDQLKSVFGAPNISGKIDIDPRVGPAQWLAQLGALLRQFNLPGADLLLEGTDIKVGGWLSELDRSKLLGSLQSLFGPGFSFGFAGDKVTEAVKSASDKTLAALDALKPGYGGVDLVNALNLWVINFATDSAEIPADSRALIARAAKAINAAPGNIAIEIAGHTDTTGDSAANQTLSEARAASVRDALVASGVPAARLTAKGYGSGQPVASNDTAYGRFQNRRIEFKLRD